MLSVSGLRGIVGKDLTADLVRKYAAGFARYLRARTVVIGRDARRSGPRYASAVIAGIRESGADVINLGIVPTPTVLHVVRHAGATGGIAITASHNPAEWNALKFVGPRGEFLTATELASFQQYLRVAHRTMRPSRQGTAAFIPSLAETHLQKIIEVVGLPGKNFQVGVDAVNGAGSRLLPLLLVRLGCDVQRVNCDPSPDFPRGPEPTATNIGRLCNLVRRRHLDLGFAVDPDCDRLAVVDDKGVPLGEEMTVVLAADHVLSQQRTPVVTNLSTTSALDWVAQRHQSRVLRTKVGEANVVDLMRHHHAGIGGEGNGGVIYPQINPTRDALVGAALILQLLAERRIRLSVLRRHYPRYCMIKTTVHCGASRFTERAAELRAALMPVLGLRATVDTTDGLRVAGGVGWVHIRPSNTEPIIRIIAEAKTMPQARGLIQRAIVALRE